MPTTARFSLRVTRMNVSLIIKSLTALASSSPFHIFLSRRPFPDAVLACLVLSLLLILLPALFCHLSCVQQGWDSLRCSSVDSYNFVTVMPLSGWRGTGLRAVLATRYTTLKFQRLQRCTHPLIDWSDVVNELKFKWFGHRLAFYPFKAATKRRKFSFLLSNFNEFFFIKYLLEGFSYLYQILNFKNIP